MLPNNKTNVARSEGGVRSLSLICTLFLTTQNTKVPEVTKILLFENMDPMGMFEGFRCM